MPIKIDCFKAYDIRGRIPDQLNPDIAYRIGNATAQYLGAKKMVLGRDIRLSSKELSDAVARGIRDAGAEVMDIQLGGTEMVYFATDYLDADGGIMVTASHNPADYNGLKIVREEARPVSADSGLLDIRALAEADKRLKARKRGVHAPVNIFELYIDHLLTYIDHTQLKPLKLVVNPGNGGAGIAMDGLRERLPFRFIDVNYAPDGTFPNGIPNPMLLENQAVTSEAVIKYGADMGIAWDGDF
jgi:phosphomannomutase/phosphomannomutase/phosphoglucomutase